MIEAENKYLFEDRQSQNEQAQRTPRISVGYHNLSEILRAASRETIYRAVSRYHQRCGHVPLAEGQGRVLIPAHTEEIDSQFDYLSVVFGKTVTPVTPEELRIINQRHQKRPLIVPYINLSETRRNLAKTGVEAKIWGLPSAIVDDLKNKASFHGLISEGGIEGLHVPDYKIIDVTNFPEKAKKFLGEIDDLYRKHNMHGYLRGIMVRPAESDGGYGAAIVREKNGHTVFQPAGDKNGEKSFDNWDEALHACDVYINSTVVSGVENRLVVSRLIDLKESPGMSVGLIDGKALSLGWNMQIQEPGTGACIGTGTHIPDESSSMQKKIHQGSIEKGFGRLIKRIAEDHNVDYRKINGFANIDIMIPGPLEFELQRRRGHENHLYVAESNPRFTNFTDAVLTGVAAKKLPQTVASMRTVIKEGITAVDKFDLPENVDPRAVRDFLIKQEEALESKGIKIISRMTSKPMGVIFLGESAKANRELIEIVRGINSRAI